MIRLSLKKYCAKMPLVILVVSAVFITSCQATDNRAETQSLQKTKQHLSHSANAPLRVITPDWGIAAELNAMGYPPVASGDLRAYKQWSGDALPAQTQDLGIRFQPNPEMMAQVKADLIIDNFFYEHIRPLYGDIPVKSINFAGKKQTYTWHYFTDLTKQLGQAIQQPKAAENYIHNSAQQLIELGKSFQQTYPSVKKLAVVQFVDANNLRMVAKNSIYQPALQTMGLELATFGEANKWGFVSIKLADLNKLDKDACLLIIKPYSDMLQAELKGSLIWQAFGFATQRCVGILEPVWAYGGIASMTSFANKLQQARLESTQLQQTRQKTEQQTQLKDTNSTKTGGDL